ncbi:MULTISPECIES: bestrophin family protein [unclassified Cupriavidus]|uniref:bestrophin family protein n=1 Tax=unclassified Cupriavidus TaxID=2640874 RepID=UPI0010F70320|nr:MULTISPECIES: bestrophin family ion channel [unclassified Cupriavidus]MWL89205.1 multidrug transporter [Cupriavidus sp. SW-Y-13]
MHLGKSYSIPEFTFWSRRKIYAALACGTLPVILYQFFEVKWLSIPTAVAVLLGTATSFIVGFRNVQTYTRAQDALQVWTEILNGSRCLGVMSRDFLAHPAARRELMLRHCAWLTALRYQLRVPKIWENAGKVSNVEYQQYYSIPEWEVPLDKALAKYLQPEELASIVNADHKTSRLLGNQSATLKRLLDAGEISSSFYMELGGSIRGFFNQQGRAERIKDYPYPRQYAIVNKIFVRTFCLLLPFGILTEFEKLNASVSGFMHGHMIWLVIPFSAMISWMYLALEQVGESTENPFEGNANDVPMAQICRRIERELMDVLGEPCDAPEPEAARGVVL